MLDSSHIRPFGNGIQNQILLTRDRIDLKETPQICHPHLHSTEAQIHINSDIFYLQLSIRMQRMHTGRYALCLIFN